MVEINDLHIEKYIKVASLSQLSKPEVLSSIEIIDKREYYRNIHSFQVLTQNSNRHQFYVSRTAPRNKILDSIVFIKETPKLLYLKGDAESLVLEQKIQDRLSDYQIFYESKQSPYFPQAESRNMIMDITDSAEDFLKHKIHYDCISPKNIVRMEQKWYLSAVGLIFGVDKDLPEYTSTYLDSEEKRMVYSWAALLFKLVFGFTPFQKNASNKPMKQFRFKNYLSYLQQEKSKLSFIKIYYFGFRVLELSQNCLDLLEMGLSGKLTIKQWREHNYFVTPIRIVSTINEKNKELKMVNAVDSSKYSLMMAAIEHRNKFPLQKINQKPNPSPEEATYSEIIDQYRKNYLLKHLKFVPGFQKKEMVMNSEQTQSVLPTLISDYFYEECFDPEQDYPCRELLKLIQKEKQENPKLHENNNRQAEIKLYAYPYAVAFELCKAQNQQPVQIKRKIKKTIELLLELSTLYYPGNIKPLHDTPTKFKQFSDMKQVYRQHINDLYRYFLNEAMRKYNSKVDTASIIQRMKKKEKGLEYYRLCLKLLEASLIVRKGGRNLDLARIETSQRKQIEQDLEQLLKNYFPNKAQIN